MNDLKDLNDRAIRDKNWRWKPGMLGDDGGRVDTIDYADEYAFSVWAFKDGDYYVASDEDNEGPAPDLRDRGTLGLLQQLVEEAWNVGFTSVYRHSVRNFEISIVLGSRETVIFNGFCPAEALVMALEASPKMTGAKYD